MPDAWLLGGCRTPMGKFLGGLAGVPAPKLGAVAVAEAVRRAGLAPEQVEEAILGCVVQAGLGQAPARQAALAAGLPSAVAAVTVNKVCGSGLKAVMQAAQAVRCGDARIVVAGGMESMSRAPHLLDGAREGWKFGPREVRDALQHDGLWCAFENCAMGVEADYIAASRQVSREDQDRFAAESHRRAVAASEAGEFDAEIVPVTIGKGGLSGGTGSSSTSAKDASILRRDEGPRPDSSLEKLSRLRPAFAADGTVTPGNASQLSDGAAAIVVTDEATARASPAPIKARVVAYATSGVPPRELFIAPVAAIEAVLKKAELRLADIDLVELNEAFAAQCLACMRPLGVDHARVNVRGGAIALGHPIGASGCRVLVTLLHALADRGLRRGLAALCLGGGNAVAMVVERVEG
jgi:acetyl-CoA C-acetyltransferase